MHIIMYTNHSWLNLPALPPDRHVHAVMMRGYYAQASGIDEIVPWSIYRVRKGLILDIA